MSNTYSTITEVLDFGPQITKVILPMEQKIPEEMLCTSQYTVIAEQTLDLPEDFEWPVFMGPKPDKVTKGQRTVESAYASDPNGNPCADGTCVTLVLAVSPMESIGSIIRFTGNFNVFVGVHYCITGCGKTFDTDGGNRIVYGEWLKTGKYHHPDSDLGYACYTPPHTEGEKLPLIIWLHGAGEGGDAPMIAAIGNKVVNFLSPMAQNIFGGKAGLLAPQAPTMWMDDGSGAYTKDGSSMYVHALDSLITDFIAENHWVDVKRIYIGGCSNGGFMTMKMILHTPERYAAAYPVCEALADTCITDAQIESIRNVPIWFTHAKTDTTVPPQDYVVPTYRRLLAAGAPDVHFTFWDAVTDLSGKYKKADGTPFEYYGHWSWIYTLNNQCTMDFDGTPVQLNGKDTTIMEWLAAHRQ